MTSNLGLARNLSGLGQVTGSNHIYPGHVTAVIKANQEANDQQLYRIPCIQYQVKFKKGSTEVQTLLDSNSEINAMTSAYVAVLGLRVSPTDLGAQKIDESTLSTHGTVLFNFQVKNKQRRVRFFQKTILVADTAMEVVLGVLFLALGKVEINFAEQELSQKTYTSEEAMPMTKHVQMINRKKFVLVALALQQEAFVVHMAYLGAKMSMHPARKAQVASLLAKKISVPEKYANISDYFTKKSAAVFSDWSNINEHTINLEPGKQAHYKPIYSLGLVKLETFRTYIETNLANRFISTSKSPAGAPIVLLREPNGSPCLCVNYRSLNNLNIKN